MPYESLAQLRKYCDDHKLEYPEKATRAVLLELKRGGKVGGKIGIHLHKGKSPTLSIQLRKICGMYPINAVQFFTHGPQHFGANTYDKDLKATAKELGVTLHVHGSYMTIPWNDDEKYMNHTLDNFRVAHQYGAKCVVLHMPKADVKDIVAGIIPLVDTIKKEKLTPFVMLEMKSLKSNGQSMESPQKLNTLADMLIKEGVDKQVRICIDTAHIDAGQASIKSYNDVKKYIADLNQSTINLIGLIHMNGNGYDSSKRAGDKHEVPLSDKDMIWRHVKYADSGCRAFIEFANTMCIDVILEIHDCHTSESIHKFMDML